MLSMNANVFIKTVCFFSHYEMIVISSKVRKHNWYFICKPKFNITFFVSRTSVFTGHVTMIFYNDYVVCQVEGSHWLFENVILFLLLQWVLFWNVFSKFFPNSQLFRVFFSLQVTGLPNLSSQQHKKL